MICPHYVEIHLLVGRSLQESIVQSAFQVWPAVTIRVGEPIPVIDECVHAMLQRSVDPLLHHLGVVIHLVTPQRLPRLIMLGESLVALLDDFPFANPLLPEPVMRQRIVMAGRPHVCADVSRVLRLSFSARRIATFARNKGRHDGSGQCHIH